jgi:hypothetical protein
MAKYIPLVWRRNRVIMMKTTVASPGPTDWASVDGVVRLQSKIGSIWAHEDASDIYVVTQEVTGRVTQHRFDRQGRGHQGSPGQATGDHR